MTHDAGLIDPVTPPEVITFVDEKCVECPAVVFIYLPERKTDTYHFVKMLASYFHGVPSQCLVQQTYIRQKSPLQ